MAGLYIHIPFCHSKCSYCDFYSGLKMNGSGAYVDALLKELHLRRAEITEPLTTVYIGGGTPSILPVAETNRLVDALHRLCDTAGVEEFTIEVNPEDVTAELLSAYRDLGINRISMGVQSFDDTMLSTINRRHSSAQALEAISLLQHGGWNYSIDLMFGLPGQTLAGWKRDVERLMELRPPHFSAYLLSYEPGTRLYAMLQAGKVTEADESLVTAMQHHITEIAATNGYRHYEISNYAMPGFHSRHNSAYWDMTPYLGIGASAHSFDGKVRRINPANIRLYLSTLSKGKIAAEAEDETPDERFNDYIITGLRTAAGLSIATLRHHFPDDFIAELHNDARPLIATGHLISADDTIRIPEAHWLQSDSIMRRLIRI